MTTDLAFLIQARRPNVSAGGLNIKHFQSRCSSYMKLNTNLYCRCLTERAEASLKLKLPSGGNKMLLTTSQLSQVIA